MLSTHSLQTPRPMTPTFMDSSTPGSIFLNRKANFRQNGREYFHYKLDTVDSSHNGYGTLPGKRRSTMNVTFNPVKNSVDPYVHASNWLPKFKDLCKGFLARQKAEELRKKHEAAQTIQRAAALHFDPWLQIFNALKPTFKVVKLDELKKYLRDCIIQIKKLNSERHFIESQLSDVEDIMEHSYQVKDNSCLSVEGRRSPNIFAKLSEVQENANNDTFLKECLDLDIEGITNVDVCFDPSSCQNSKVHMVYELADKLQQKIHEDRHKWQNLQEKCQHLEKEIGDLRSTNTTLDTTTRMLRGMINKHDINLQEQKDKVQEYVALLEKINQEKKTSQNKIKEQERILLKKDEDLVALNGKCEYYETELDRKTKTLETLNQEKIRNDKKLKELEEKLTYNLENQSELESTIELQKHRLRDLKERLSDQLKTTEEELMKTINATKMELNEQNELIESQNERIKQYEKTIWRLEHEIGEAKDKDVSEEEIDYERERKLGQQLKNANANLDTQREEMKVMESNYEEMKKRVIELQTNLEKANEETTEHKKVSERLKAQIESLKSSLNETELKLNRANREKNFNNQKWTQAKEKNADLERELIKLTQELNTSLQSLTTKNREFESLDKEFNESKKNYENRISIVEKNVVDLQEKLDQSVNTLAHKSEEWKKTSKNYEYKIEELRQCLDDKEAEIDQFEMDKLDHQKTLKKLQRRIEEQEEVQQEKQKTITKLKDQIQSLQDENESQWKTLPNSGVTSPMEQWDKNMSRSSTSITTPSPSQTEGYFTLPTRRTARQLPQ